MHDELNDPTPFPQDPDKIVAAFLPALVWISGPDKLCRYVNEAWLKFTGRTLEQETGKGWADNIHPEDMAVCLAVFEKAFDARATCNLQYRLRRSDGAYRWVTDQRLPRYEDNGAFAGYIGSCMDITDLVLSEKKIQENIHIEAFEQQQVMNEELAALNEELTTSNEELIQAQDDLSLLNQELERKVWQRTQALEQSEAEAQALNEELSATNEELNAANEELTATNDELFASEANLYRSINELTLAKQQLEQSEHLFRSIALNIPGSLILVVDKDRRLITLEGDLMEKLGYERKDYEGRHIKEVIPGERYETSRRYYDRVLAGEKFSIEQKSSSNDDFMVHFVPLKDDKLNVYAGLVIVLDITEIKQAERNSARLAAIVESSDDAIISKTLDGIITSWNESAERTFGYKPHEVIGQSILKLIPADRKEEEPKILERLRRGERVEHFETKRITKDKKILDLSLTISPIRDKQGNIIGLSKIARDISERKRAEERKNDFIGMVSHELKTPLTSLTLLLQMLEFKLKESDDPFVTDALAKGSLQVKRMNNLINGFLNVSRLESSELQMANKAFDLAKLVRETADEMAVTTAVHTLELQTAGETIVLADRERIGSVISNLLSNAIKYSPHGKSIRIALHTQGSEAIVSVQDSGIGIRQEELSRIFERYYRVEGNDTRFIAGFGIGLYLSQEIISRQHGRLWAESEPGKGSIFYFSLPLHSH